ncbi:hypothetical protein [Verrucosispora sioxanthis]|uniref:hypothetical protein n=1 Tax=Verrucosispora sioxanthis TaxID=2499994 RepID=UPI001C101946|nr:hypothetical protein [Verrucosispora sioxanthis]
MVPTAARPQRSGCRPGQVAARRSAVLLRIRRRRLRGTPPAVAVRADPLIGGGTDRFVVDVAVRVRRGVRVATADEVTAVTVDHRAVGAGRLPGVVTPLVAGTRGDVLGPAPVLVAAGRLGVAALPIRVRLGLALAPSLRFGSWVPVVAPIRVTSFGLPAGVPLRVASRVPVGIALVAGAIRVAPVGFARVSAVHVAVRETTPSRPLGASSYDERRPSVRARSVREPGGTDRSYGCAPFGLPAGRRSGISCRPGQPSGSSSQDRPT